MLVRNRGPYTLPMKLAATGYGAYKQYRQYQGAAQNAGKVIKAVSSAVSKARSGPLNRGAAAPIKGRSTRSSKPRRGKKQKKAQQTKNAIRELQRNDRATMGKMTVRHLYSAALSSGVNAQAASLAANPNSITQLEDQLQYLKYYDPSNPGTLITANGATGVFQRNIQFKSISSTMTVRNNYQTDADVSIYLCKAKDDTDLDAYGAWQSGLLNQTNVGTTAALGQYPTDYDILKDLYSIKQMSKTVISPGQSVRVSHSVGPIEYDPATADTHNLEYQKEYKNFQFLIVVRGTVGHDTALDQQTLVQAGVDYTVKNTYVVQYSAGSSINYTQITNNMDAAFTNGGVQSHQPVPDNIGYSQA